MKSEMKPLAGGGQIQAEVQDPADAPATLQVEQAPVQPEVAERPAEGAEVQAPAKVPKKGRKPKGEAPATEGESALPKKRRSKKVAGEPAASVESPVEPPKARKGRGKTVVEEAAPAAAKPKAKKGSKTLADLAESYVESLEAAGKSAGTTQSYRMECRMALDAWGDETPVAALTVEQVRAFFDSDRVQKLRSGREKSPLSVAKTQRVAAQMLRHAVMIGWLKRAPIPESDAN